MRGASDETVRRAIETGDPLPGTAGFAGELDGRLVRDVLGRQPLFTERTEPTTWSFDLTALEDPEPVPAGFTRTPAGDQRLWTLPDPPAETDPERAVETLRQAVWTSVDEMPREGVAVAFSGGVDSAIVATGRSDAPCYVAGFQGAHDVEAARAAADAMGCDLRVVDLTHDDLRRAVPAIVRATGLTNAMDVQIALPLFLTAERAAADGYDALAVGQGADELFGGYAKVVDPASDHRVDADTVRGATREIVSTLPAQLQRDVLTLRAAGVEPVAPLLHDRVVAAALPLRGSLLATADERKVALRRVARDRVPDSVASADKKAVQYGSLAARELDRLARQAGFKRRMDDHVGRYVRSLVTK